MYLYLFLHVQDIGGFKKEMTEVEEFIYQFEDDQRKMMLFLHNWLTKDLTLTEKMRFNIPFYFGKSWICYLNPTKKGKIEFAFVRGNELSNEQGLLDSKGRKQVYSIEFEKINDIPKQALNEIIQEAILLDEAKPYQSKRKLK
ncbi:MAG: DUF1801 domain-containing protein [Arenibacter latericius]|nr:DUF1801 domain-containing protein [Arenibacter latericius]